MSNTPDNAESPLGALEFRLLGQVDFDRCQRLQEHLVRAVVDDPHPRIVVLLAEHPRLISVGRQGSRLHVRISEEQLRRKRIALRWVTRGGGCVLHGPGQLAIYPLVPLKQADWRVGDYMRRFQTGILHALDMIGVRAELSSNAGDHGIRGRSGRLATFGVAVRDGVTHHGAFLNVNPPMQDFKYVRMPGSGVAASSEVMGSLLSERKHAGRMTKVRTQVIASLGEAFGSPNYHMFTGHPFLSRLPKAPSEPARAI